MTLKEIHKQLRQANVVWVRIQGPMPWRVCITHEEARKIVETAHMHGYRITCDLESNVRWLTLHIKSRTKTS